MLSKSEVAKLVLQEDLTREVYGFPLLPPFFMRLQPKAGICSACNEKGGLRHGYCYACIRPELINLLFN
jgi:hypothetical protein